MPYGREGGGAARREANNAMSLVQKKGKGRISSLPGVRSGLAGLGARWSNLHLDQPRLPNAARQVAALVPTWTPRSCPQLPATR